MTRTVNAAKEVTPTKFAHFVLLARDLEASITWYQTVLEMRIQHRNEQLAFLTYDDEHHRLAIAQAPNTEDVPRGTPGVDHVAYTLDSLEDLLCLYKRLKAEDILPVWPINHGLTTSMYYEDPDGNRSEFQIDVLDVEAANEFMDSPAFAANPIGEDFDPDELLTAHRAGRDLTELVFRSDQEPVAVPALAAPSAGALEVGP